MSPNPLLPIEHPILGDIYSSREVMDNLEVLCDDFGSRWGGTEGERLAAEFALCKFTEYGLPGGSLEPFNYIGWRRGPATLRVLAPRPLGGARGEIPCIPLRMCPP